MLCSVDSRIFSDHWASKGCGMENRNRMKCGWSSSLMVFAMGCVGGHNRGMCMVALTPLWSSNA